MSWARHQYHGCYSNLIQRPMVLPMEKVSSRACHRPHHSMQSRTPSKHGLVQSTNVSLPSDRTPAAQQASMNQTNAVHVSHNIGSRCWWHPHSTQQCCVAVAHYCITVHHCRPVTTSLVDACQFHEETCGRCSSEATDESSYIFCR